MPVRSIASTRTVRRRLAAGATIAVLGGLLAAGCGGEGSAPAPAPAGAPEAPAADPAGASTPATPPAAASAPATPADLGRGLLVAISQFATGPDGKPVPGPARLELVTRAGGAWKVDAVEDPASNVFHKALVLDPAAAGAPSPNGPGILTLGGMAAALKLWHRGPEGWSAETVWEKRFGGSFDRMRDAEAADLDGDGQLELAVATHDQGVVAVVDGGPEGWKVTEIDQQKDTFVHEIEIGDLDGDGTLEVYATPSAPNKLDGTPQPGQVTRYVPARGEGRVVVADLGHRHAKEILVGDVDGDGRDELYVAVEAHTEGSGANARLVEPVEIRRYDADTDPKQGVVVAQLDDRLCRFLTAGDVDGDGRREMVAAGFKSGLWLLRPSAEKPTAESIADPEHHPDHQWSVSSIDRASSGFEHAALLTDLDGDGRDELYVASDDQAELRRYVWNGRGFSKEVLQARPSRGAVLTWNLMPVPVELLAPR